MENVNAATEILNHALKGKPLIKAEFSPDFIQYLNGSTINCEAFHEGIKSLRKEYSRIDLKILSMASSADSVLSHHLVTTTNMENETARFEVFARYEFSGGKAIRCFESLRELTDEDPVGSFF